MERARSTGHDVTVVCAGAGASALGGGAVDDVPWEQLVRAARALGGEPIGLRPDRAGRRRVLARRSALWDLPGEGAPPPFVATIAGRLRPARGRDRGRCSTSARSTTPACSRRARSRAAWDADAIASALSDEPFARERNGSGSSRSTRPSLRFDEERAHRRRRSRARATTTRRVSAGSPSGCARRSRDRRHRRAIPPACSSARGSARARPAPPSSPRAPRVPVGEALVGAGSPAGLRFEAARDRLLGALGVEVVVRSRALDPPRGRPRGRHARARFRFHHGGRRRARDGRRRRGGIVYAPPEHAAGEDLPPRGAVPYALSIDAPVALAAFGRRLDVVASIHGPELDTSTWSRDARPSLLEAVGVLAPEGRAAEGVLVAGDLVAGRPRTLLEAVASGLRAGSSA